MINITQEQLREKMKIMVGELGSQKALAAHLGVSEPHLSDMLRGNRNITVNAAKKLGYSREMLFVEDGECGT